MKMHPPAQINARVTNERLRWLAEQPFIIKVQPGFKIPSSWSKAFKASDSVDITTKEYVVDDRTKNFIMYELARILSYHGYQSCSTDLGNGDSIFEVSKNGWDMQFKNLRESLPFTESFLAQIEKSYNHHMQDVAFNKIIDSESLKAFDDANLSLGQIWSHKWKLYDVKITYLGRNVAGVKVEELATGKVDAFCIELFLERFSYKDSGQ